MSVRIYLFKKTMIQFIQIEEAPSKQKQNKKINWWDVQ